MSKILVTGGAGYIGSHTVVDLLDNGFEVVSVDNFDNSSQEALDGIERITGKKIKNYQVDICDLDALREIFREHNILASIHFAAYKSVGESVADPLLYYHNNLAGMVNLLKCHAEFGIKHLIFSSSCSVYGNTDVLPVTEDTPWSEAESPYGRTKQICEHMIREYAATQPDQSFVLLRYFNPAGAHESIEIGEAAQNKATNLVPVITEVAIGERPELLVFGDDYPTRDGSCIRDFIHIMDLAHAHTLALQFLIAGKNPNQSEVFNLGTGKGTSVLEAVKAFEKVSDQLLNYRIAPRRSGDVVSVYADYQKAKELLGWNPERTVEEIMDTAWKWQQKVST